MVENHRRPFRYIIAIAIEECDAAFPAVIVEDMDIPILVISPK